ncbi:MAG: glutamate formimidoyltransferase [Euryarchaeota archaeon]|jgi:glutamate formiminotransferase/formiminotetrahydrofolate cyclodeaminase|nr:glutamate formimidoyltransferase [Euryarchaeota archaeon]
MADQLVECVPNFSEGKDKEVIDAITDEMLTVSGVKLLDVDMGADFHRTVVTIVGPPEQVLEAVLRGTGIALSSIDMTTHNGEHARMGAIDVVPFIPVRNISMDECVILAERYGQQCADRFGHSVYLYAKAARRQDRIRLPDIRRGEYEALSDKLGSEEWAPEYGPNKFNPTSGVTASGARSILIAYNVNLNTADKSITNNIAGKLRTSGVLKKDENGEKILDSDGKPERINGKFDALQGAGWMYDDQTAQVSMNLLDYKTTGLHQVTDAIRELASQTNHQTTAGELVGLVPLDAILDSGRHYHGKDASDDVLIASAVEGLQLNKLGEFIVEQRIIEYAAGV